MKLYGHIVAFSIVLLMDGQQGWADGWMMVPQSSNINGLFSAVVGGETDRQQETQDEIEGGLTLE